MYTGRIDPIVFVALAVVLAGCLFSVWKGGHAERIGGVIVLSNTLLVWAIAMFGTASVQSVAELVVDGLTALGLLAVVLIYGSLWLGGAMLLYGLQFTLHAFYFVTERAPDRLHAIINNLDFSGILWCLVIGTAVAWRRRTRIAVAA
jgi:hypothetical protein